MTDDLTSMWGNFTLTEEEGDIDEAPEEEIMEMGNKGSSCLVGRLMADHVVEKEIIRAKLTQAWKPINRSCGVL